MMNLNKVYIPILEKIYNEVSRIDIDKINEGIPDIFIPGAGKLYEQANKKVLYIGKDTNGWYSIRNTTYKYGREANEIKKKKVLEEVIARASSALNNNEHLNEWWENGRSQFWDYIFKLQLHINNLDCEEKLNKEWMEKNELLTQSFAWGNSRLFQQLNLNKDITDSDFYKKINEFVNMKNDKGRECFKNILEALQPDIIVILNWDEYEAFIGKYTAKVSYKDEFAEKNIDSDLCKEQLDKIKIEYYQLESGQHVFWTYHPRGTIYKGGVDVWVKAMFQFMKSRKVI